MIPVRKDRKLIAVVLKHHYNGLPDPAGPSPTPELPRGANTRRPGRPCQRNMVLRLVSAFGRLQIIRPSPCPLPNQTHIQIQARRGRPLPDYTERGHVSRFYICPHPCQRIAFGATNQRMSTASGPIRLFAQYSLTGEKCNLCPRWVHLDKRNRQLGLRSEATIESCYNFVMRSQCVRNRIDIPSLTDLYRISVTVHGLIHAKLEHIHV